MDAEAALFEVIAIGKFLVPWSLSSDTEVPISHICGDVGL